MSQCIPSGGKNIRENAEPVGRLGFWLDMLRRFYHLVATG